MNMEEQLLRNSAMPRNLKLFIGGLSFETSDDTLRNYFRQWGMVTDAVVMKDGVSRRSRGFGFITYADPHSVEYALAQPEHIIDGRRVEAKRAVPRSDMALASAQAAAANAQDMYGVPHDADGLDMTPLRDRAPSNASCSSGGGGGGAGGGGALPQDGAAHGGTKVFVGGLHYETRDNAFRTYFEQFGKVLAADVMFNRETHKSRGFGFVVFESADSAAKVLQTSHHTINGKVVEVKRAVPRMMQAPGATLQQPSAVAQHGSAFMSPITTPLRHRGSMSSGGGGDGGKDSALQGMIAQQLHQQHMQNVARFAAVAAAAAADSYAAALRYGPAPSGGYASQNGDHEQPAQHQQQHQQQQRIAPLPQPLRMPSASPLFAPSTLYHGGAAVDPSYLLLPQAAAGARTDAWGLSGGGGDAGSGSGVPPLDLDGQALDSYAMPPPGAPTPAGLKDVRYAFSHAGAGYTQQPPQQRRASHGGGGGGGARGVGFSPFQLPLDRNSNQPPSKEGADLSPFFGAQPGPEGQPLGGMRIGGGGGGGGGAAASSMLEAAMADLQLGGAVPSRDMSLFSFAAGGGSAAGGGGGGGYGAAGPDSDETFGRDDGASSVGSGAAAAANGGARSTNVLAPWSSDFFGRGFAADCGGGDEAGGVGAAAAGAGFEERANGCAGGGDACVGPDWRASRDWPAYHGNDEVAGEGRGGGARSVSPVIAAAVAVLPQPLQQQQCSPAAGLCGQADAENQQLAGDGAGAAAARLGLLPSGQACGLPLSTAARFESSLF